MTRAALPGDVDCDESVTAGDLVAVGLALFGDGRGLGDGARCSADANGDGVTGATDVVTIVRALMQPPSTPTPRIGPRIAFLGVAGADGTVGSPVATAPDVPPVFQRQGGTGFQLVIEALPGTSGAPIGTVVFDADPHDPSVRPDLQIEASQRLGDGSPGVCSDGAIGGFNPPDFSLRQEVADALNQLGCGFTVNTNSAKACTTDAFGTPIFVSGDSRAVQFCLLVTGARAFPLGETTLSVQVRDVVGNIGPLAHMVVRVGSQPIPTTTSTRPPPRTTFTATSTAARTQTPATTIRPTSSPTITPGLSPLITSTPTVSPTRAATAVTTPTATASRTPPLTGTRPVTPAVTASATRTATSPARTTGTPTTRPSASTTRTPTSTPTATASPTVTRTATNSATPTRSQTPTPTRTPTTTPTTTSTPTTTLTPTITLTPTATVPPEPVITFFGVARIDDTLVAPSGVSPQGALIFERAAPGSGFRIVVEGRPGGTGARVGESTFNWNPTDPATLPDLQIVASNALGLSPTTDVCDDAPPNFGGVPPATLPASTPTQQQADAINDLACRFKDGADARLGRGASDACTVFDDGLYRFVVVDSTNPRLSSTIQFCGLINDPLTFPADANTVLTARIRDVEGHLSAPARITVHIAAP